MDNRCRLHLKVLSVVDIADGHGTELDINILTVAFYPGEGEFDEMVRPGMAWRQALGLILCPGNNIRLSSGLGGWHEKTVLDVLPKYQ